MRRKEFVFAVVLLAAIVAPISMFTAERSADRTRTSAPVKYVPTVADLAYTGVTVGDVAEADIEALGSDTAYIGLVLNGDGVNPNAPHLFIKMQQQGIGFSFGACYLGYNGSAGSFGLEFFPLTQPFIGGHMKVSRNGSDVTIQLTKLVNGVAVPDQTYTCTGAPAPVGDKIGAHGHHPDDTHTPRLGNFGDGSSILDRFNTLGLFAWTGNWIDVVSGMHTHLFYAEAGHPVADGSMSFWRGTPRINSIWPKSGAQGTTMNVRLTGLNFRIPGTTVSVSGTGVNVVALNLDGNSTSTNLTAKLVIEPTAPVGQRTVTVTTPQGTANDAARFTVTSPTPACAVSLPLTASGSAGNLDVTAGIGASRPMAGRWGVGYMVFKPQSVTFYGHMLYSGNVPPINPPTTRSLSFNVGAVPAVAVVNAFYSPNLCGQSIVWASTTSSGTPYDAVPKSEVDAALRNITPEDFNATYVEIPR